MEIAVAAIAGVVLGLLAGLIGMAHRQPRCRCGRLLPLTCPYGYGCHENVRPWIAAQAEQLDAEARARRARGERS